MKDKIFGVLQRVGRSFMLPIALLPVAGLLLGIGSSFTNETMLAAYGLNSVIHPGTLIYTILDVMSQTGSAVFNNLALLFAMGVAIGMARKEKEVAALSGAVAYIIMNTAIQAMINAAGGVDAMPANSTTTMLGITTLQMGVFGGIVVGLGVAALHNKFYKIELPQVLAFFGGTRFVPIISSIVYLVVGIAMFYIWPVVQSGIAALGALVLASGYAGTFIYGLLERALIPFGLHHVFYMPFWQTAVGGTAIIDGVTVTGAQNIFFAELASKSTTVFSVSATRFMAGKFPFMMFGLPGAALAMYHCAKPEKKKAAGGLLLSAALTAFLTGITEPLEFTFIFVALPMYAVHCVLAGLSFMLMHILNVGVGMTFSGGLIDLVLFGAMQGNAKTHWIWVVVVGAVYFVLYYLIFRFMISKFDYKTPGRDDAEEVKLYTRADVNARSAASGSNAPAGDDPVSALIVEGLGGTDNLSDVDCCATRLRCTVKDAALVRQDVLKASGASGVICKGNGVQVVYGPKVAVIKAKLEDYLENAPKTPAAPAAPAPAAAPAAPAAAAKDTVLAACLTGTVVPLAEVKDEAFASGALGDGIAIEPAVGELVAPADGEISSTFDTHHAVGMTTVDGAELLMHIGIDTVKLGGKHFTYLVNEGDKVRKGQPLIRFDIEAIKAEGYPVTTPLIVCNTDEYAAVTPKASGTVKQGDALLELKG
ncbi:MULTISPECIES: PTS transporter subunit IIABC [Faecalibacterium]|uniref:Glucose PTS transporter subunit IIA n=1 Tax=Faecalibacterium wellingii TaxID=2929491 RepID=A0ABU3U1I9_9FIRM|nr:MULTISPECIES: PTS transporter subunit IIABC [Faecalibacterium]MDU8689443.1 glucose PTS transporter subunit IIA [Faecalibacterium prausnitzii]UQK56972.1 glucose PTS transporter subunit IIA [Faecalibacterium sp. HTF-F]